MAVTNSKEMEAELAKHIWHQNVRILILLVWIARLVAHAGRERKLCDAVEPLSCNFHLVMRSFRFFIWHFTRFRLAILLRIQKLARKLDI